MKIKRLILFTFILCFAATTCQAKGHGGWHCVKNTRHYSTGYSTSRASNHYSNANADAIARIAFAVLQIIFMKK